MLDGQLITGGVVSTMVTVWLHEALLVQQSVTCQVRVIASAQGPAMLVVVPTTMTVTWLLQQGLDAVGLSKLHDEPHSTVLFVAQVKLKRFWPKL